MDKDKETRDTWNNLAALYQEKFMDMDLYNETYDHVCASIAKPNAQLLEMGCGPGNITKYLLSKRPDFAIVGIDNAPSMIELAKANNPSASFAVMDIREIRKLDSRFDGIIGGFCLPYVSPVESRALITDAYDLLNNDGIIYLSFVAGDPERSGFKTGSGGRVYFHYHRLDDVRSHLESAGFGELSTFEVAYTTSGTVDDIHTIVTARKKGSR